MKQLALGLNKELYDSGRTPQESHTHRTYLTMREVDLLQPV